MKLYRSAINTTDLAALTAKTGYEFALFRLGSQRVVVRGANNGLDIRGKLYDELTSNNYRWSAHTHPGTNVNVLMTSGFPGDRHALQQFKRNQSMILNDSGQRAVFGLETERLVTALRNIILIHRCYMKLKKTDDQPARDFMSRSYREW